MHNFLFIHMYIYIYIRLHNPDVCPDKDRKKKGNILLFHSVFGMCKWYLVEKKNELHTVILSHKLQEDVVTNIKYQLFLVANIKQLITIRQKKT